MAFVKCVCVWVCACVFLALIYWAAFRLRLCYSRHEQFIIASLWSEFANNFSAFSVAVLLIWFWFYVFNVVANARNLTLHRPHIQWTLLEPKVQNRKNSFLLHHSTVPLTSFASFSHCNTTLEHIYAGTERRNFGYLQRIAWFGLMSLTIKVICETNHRLILQSRITRFRTDKANGIGIRR